MKIIVVGCGRLGSGLSRSLSEAGHDVTVVDTELAAFDQLGSTFRGRTVQGVAFDRDVLTRAGIEGAEGFAATTASDNANALAAHMARDIFKVPRVVARVYNPSRLPLYERLKLQTVVSVSWGVRQIEYLLTSSEQQSVLVIGNHEVEVVQVIIPDRLSGLPLQRFTLGGYANPVAVTHMGVTALPAPDMQLITGDVLLLAVMTEALPRLTALVQGKEA
jgi:trk system potassium uptake protein TrkA